MAEVKGAPSVLAHPYRKFHAVLRKAIESTCLMKVVLEESCEISKLLSNKMQRPQTASFSVSYPIMKAAGPRKWQVIETEVSERVDEIMKSYMKLEMGNVPEELERYCIISVKRSHKHNGVLFSMKIGYHSIDPADVAEGVAPWLTAAYCSLVVTQETLARRLQSKHLRFVRNATKRIQIQKEKHAEQMMVLFLLSYLAGVITVADKLYWAITAAGCVGILFIIFKWSTDKLAEKKV